jgi:hypothetical protein
MMTTSIDIDETRLDAFRPNYADRFIQYHARKFDWTSEYIRRVTRDAFRFLALSALPPAGEETATAYVMVCSHIVDKIVDAIFLDVPLLIWLEREVFHVRLLHIPYYAHGVTDVAINNARYDFTISMMLSAGYQIDRDIWPVRLPINYAPCHGGNDLDDCSVQRQDTYDGT